MKKPFRSMLSLAMSVLVLLTVVAMPVTAAAVTTPPAETLKMHVLGIGQGDSIFFELPGKQSMLIDAGNPGDGSAILGYIKKLGYSKIDYLVATHPHADHIGGMADVVKSIGIGKVYMSEGMTTTKTFENLLDALSAKGLKVAKAKAGVNVISSDQLKADFVAPVGAGYGNLNNYSAALKITYGTKSFLLMGDAERESEAQITANVKADVLKVGHHGSDTSSSTAFIAKVKPTYAVISVGTGNTYGHPTAVALQTFKNVGATVYRTDIDGTVIFSTDGNTLTVTKAAAVANGGVTAEESTPAPAALVKPSAPVTPSSQSNTASTAAPAQKNEQTVYWGQTGTKYHIDPNCRSFKDTTPNSGTIAQAKASGRVGWCGICSKGMQ